MNKEIVPGDKLGNEMNISNNNSASTAQEEEIYLNFLSASQVNDDIMEEKGLVEEDIYLNKAEEKHFIFSSEEKFQFFLFTPKKKNYYYDSLYSKELLFKEIDIPQGKKKNRNFRR